MLSLHRLEIFVAVVEAGTISAAAEQLYISQSAVSQHVKDLEASLGVVLFERSRRGVTLTPAGRTLRDYALDILKLVAEAETAVTNVRNLADGQITIGVTPGISVYLIPGWLQDFRTHYPNLTTSIQTGVTDEIIAGVLGRKLDVGFVEGEIDENINQRLGMLELRDVPQKVVIGQRHPWWGRESITIDELDSQNVVMRQQSSQTRTWLNQILQLHDVAPHVTGEFDNPEALKNAVISGLCLTIFPDYIVEREIEMNLMQSLPVDDVKLERTLKLLWCQSRPFSPLVSALLKVLSRQFVQINDIL